MTAKSFWIGAASFVVTSLLLAGCYHNLAPAPNADFYECPPNNTLKVCAVGTVPAGCEYVGTGTTTLPVVNC